MKKILLGGFVLMFFACGKKDQKIVVPPSILSKEKMTDLIVQIHLAEAKANLNAAPDVPLNTKINFKEILDRNNLSPNQYDSSLTFYLNHATLFNEVYEAAINEMSTKESRLK
jgi:hypothetical protein